MNQYPLPNLPGILKPCLREVTSLTSWMFTFLAYVAIWSDNAATHIMLANHPGGTAPWRDGWIPYDKVFRQQAAIDGTLLWNTLHHGIQATTLLGQAPGQWVFCTLCGEPGHRAAGCALSYLQDPQLGTSTGAANPKPHQSLRWRRASDQRVCRSWNRGECIFPNCTFRHVCETCGRHYMTRDFPDTPGRSRKALSQGRDSERPPPPSPKMPP